MEILNFSDSDFAKMKIPAHKVSPTTKIVKKHNLLRIHSEFSADLKGLDRTKVIKWIIFCFDPESPFVNSVSDLHSRRIQAAIEAGFEDPGKYSKDIKRALQMQEPIVNMMIMKYCEICKPSVYSTIVALRQSLLADLLEIMDKGLKSSEKKNLLGNIEVTERIISEKERSLFSGSEEDGLKEALLNYSDSASVGITPEIYAKILRGDNIPEDIFKPIKRDYATVKSGKAHRVLELESEEIDYMPVTNIIK